MRTHTHAIAALFLLSSAIGVYALMPAGALQPTNVTIELLGLDGTPLDGDANVFVTQEDLSGAPAHGDYVWGPHLVSLTGGNGQFTANMPGLDDSRTVTVQVEPGGLGGLQPYPSSGFFVDPEVGARAQVDVFPIPQAGGSAKIAARGMRLVPAPAYGRLQITPSSPPVGSLNIHAAAEFDNKLLFPESAYPLAVSWPQGGAIVLYHWGTAASVDVRAMAAGGWDSGVHVLHRGQTLPLALYDVGGLQVHIPTSVAADAARVIAIPAATHVPFTASGGLSHGDNVGAAFIHVLGGVPAGESMNGTVHDFTQLPPGDYVVEVWTSSGVNPNPSTDPSPYFVGTATVSSGSTTMVTVD